MKILQVHFKHGEHRVHLTVQYDDRAVKRSKNGFWIWIDDNLPMLAQTMKDAVYFIPPHMVDYLELREVEVEDYEQYNGPIQQFPE